MFDDLNLAYFIVSNLPRMRFPKFNRLALIYLFAGPTDLLTYFINVPIVNVKDPATRIASTGRADIVQVHFARLLTLKPHSTRKEECSRWKIVFTPAYVIAINISCLSIYNYVFWEIILIVFGGNKCFLTHHLEPRDFRDSFHTHRVPTRVFLYLPLIISTSYIDFWSSVVIRFVDFLRRHLHRLWFSSTDQR